VAQYDRIAYCELIKRFCEQIRLGCCGPDPRARPLTIPKPRPIEAHDTIVTGKKLYEATDNKILDHRAVAMEQHDARRAKHTAIEIMKAYTVAFHE
jgi:hypothetical protein